MKSQIFWAQLDQKSAEIAIFVRDAPPLLVGLSLHDNCKDTKNSQIFVKLILLIIIHSQITAY